MSKISTCKHVYNISRFNLGIKFFYRSFSGYITSNEFIEACNLIKEHIPCPISNDQLEEICKLMDLNKDGLVDLNEFLESFRMVDPESRQVARGSFSQEFAS